MKKSLIPIIFLSVVLFAFMIYNITNASKTDDNRITPIISEEWPSYLEWILQTNPIDAEKIRKDDITYLLIYAGKRAIIIYCVDVYGISEPIAILSFYIHSNDAPDIWIKKSYKEKLYLLIKETFRISLQ